MKRRLFALPLLACLLLALLIGGQPGSAKPLPRPPRGFFGMAPQTSLTELDARYMRAGGIESIRLPLLWSSIQPTRNGPYDWSGFDDMVEVAARAGLRVFPSLASPPAWIARKETSLPVNARQQRAWAAFLAAAVARYGPGGEFWAQHGGIGVNYEPAISTPIPIREWQIWNEPNFFYFAYPVSVSRYAKLLTVSSRTIKAVDPGAKVIRCVDASFSTRKLSEPALAPAAAETTAAVESEVDFMPPQVSALPSALAADARLESLLLTLW